MLLTFNGGPFPMNASNDTTAYRIVDANLNRCLEGLRVVEDHVRFALEDQHLASECKRLRHDVVESLCALDTRRLHAARDAAHDVGTRVSAADEYARASVQAVAVANWSRVRQAMRSLEEYVKVIAPRAAPALESLRYRAYQLERAVTTLHRGLELLARARLYVLLDGRPSVDEFLQLAGALIEGGAELLQLRDKTLEDRLLLERARLLRDVTRNRGVLFIVNDRVDVALLSGADGVHVGQREVTVKDARRLLGTDALIGVSTHCLEQARQAVLDGADYLGCGPTFPSMTKQFHEFSGLEFLREVHREIRLPAFAIGGIDRHNVDQVRATGFSRIAVGHGIVSAGDPRGESRRLRAALPTDGL